MVGQKEQKWKSDAHRPTFTTTVTGCLHVNLTRFTLPLVQQMKQVELDLSSSPRREIADQILLVASALFDSVKSAPMSARKNLPQILRNNNFGFAVRVTATHAFLEITTKLHAHRSREAERLRAYRQIFTSIESGQPAIFKVDKARLIRIGAMTLEAPHAFALGSDLSMCAWEARSTTKVAGKMSTHDIDIIYVVGFGEAISVDDVWQEFDTLIRVTLSDWSGTR